MNIFYKSKSWFKYNWKLILFIALLSIALALLAIPAIYGLINPEVSRLQLLYKFWYYYVPAIIILIFLKIKYTL